MLATAETYQPLFPWFGGKSSVADIVWQRLGDPANYVEPFIGSAAVLLLRPESDGIETINDADGFVANVWRALRHDPDEVAYWADEQVNECELHAAHLWLVSQRESLTARLCGDMDYYDAKAAGRWIWGASCWIGSGWCTGKGPWQAVDGVMTNVSAGRGVNRQLPHLGNAGRGVNRQLPHLGDAGKGVPEITRYTFARLGEKIVTNRFWWLRELCAEYAARLRQVRVCCGDWQRVMGPSVTTKHGVTGVFLDPPYADTANRASELYSVDSLSVAHDVREWALANGDNPLFRICLAGYEGEHDMPESWDVVEWKARGGYSNTGSGETRGIENRHKERLWFSPHCLRPERLKQTTMFAEEC